VIKISDGPHHIKTIAIENAPLKSSQGPLYCSFNYFTSNPLIRSYRPRWREKTKISLIQNFYGHKNQLDPHHIKTIAIENAPLKSSQGPLYCSFNYFTSNPLIRSYRPKWREKTKISLIQTFYGHKNVFNGQSSFNIVSCNVVHLRLRYISFFLSHCKLICKNRWTAWMKHIHHGGAHRAQPPAMVPGGVTRCDGLSIDVPCTARLCTTGYSL
jgi:hypothetical protein